MKTDGEEMKTFPTFAEFLAESKKSRKDDDPLNEGEGAAGGASAGGDAGGSGDAGGDASYTPGSLDGDAAFMHGGKAITTTEDVLGKFDPKKGCMGKGDFHLPKMIGKLQHRWPCCNGGSKRKKDKNGKDKKYYHEKGMKVITSYADLTEDQKQAVKPVLVYNIPFSRVGEILDTTTIENTRFDRQQFMKYVEGNDERDLEAVALFAEFPRECLAMAILAFDSAKADDCYICEIQSFKKGYGKELILKLLKYQKKLWLMARANADEKLLDFYRDPAFKFREHLVKNSVYGCQTHFFYTPECDEEKLLSYIDASFSEEPNAVDEAEEARVKIWVDDVRPTPPGYITIKSVNEFMDWYEKNRADKIQVLDLDHDAGDFHADGGDYIKILDFLEFSGVEDLAVRIHSDNPVGRQNMQRIIKKNGWKEVFDIIGESKNKITAHPKVIQQKKVSLKTKTVEKAPKIVAAKATDAREKEQTIKQDKLAKAPVKKVIANQLRSKESKAQPKRTVSQKEVKDFKQPKIAVKKISFPKEETEQLKKQEQIITTRVSDDYDEFQLGDIVAASWGSQYKVIARRNIGSVSEHPWKECLTDKQVEELKKHTKLAVLTLALQKEKKKLNEANYNVLANNSSNVDLMNGLKANKLLKAAIPLKFENYFAFDLHSFDEISMMFRLKEGKIFNRDNKWYIAATMSKGFCKLAKERAIAIRRPTKADELKRKEMIKQANAVFDKIASQVAISFIDGQCIDVSNDYRPAYAQQSNRYATTFKSFGIGQEIFLFQVAVEFKDLGEEE